jgi:arsenate reductase (glutaredoxin)
MGGKTGVKRTNVADRDRVVIWHNPRCSKSRQTLALLRERGLEPEVREYLVHPPTVAELEDVLGKLGLEPHELMRTKETAYRELQLSPGKPRQTLLRAMHDTPILIERPVVIRGRRAALGRPPEQVTALFE